MMNGPLKFLTARKILPLLNLLAKFKRALGCSCSSNFCVARKLAKQIVISARARTGSPSALCVGSGTFYFYVIFDFQIKFTFISFHFNGFFDFQ